MTECDGCGLERDPVQTVDVYDGTEFYCVVCAEVPAGNDANRKESQ